MVPNQTAPLEQTDLGFFLLFLSHANDLLVAINELKIMT